MLVARERDEVGTAVIDWYTPLHFGVGAAAGALGVSPLLATAVFIGAGALKLALKEGMDDAFFAPGAGQSHANELSDLLVKFLGYVVGQKARTLISGGSQAGLGGKIVGLGPVPGPARPPTPEDLKRANQALLRTPG